MEPQVESADLSSTESPDLSHSPQTPTPAMTPILNMNSSSSRRPPRKSTLTQQQKNQKRQRATQDQLVTLEVEFNKNPTPTAMVRERIASDINMTERSVQIWFQNRRAKIKNIARKSIENGEDCESIPESMRRHLAVQAMESGKPFFPGFMGGAAGYAPFGNGTMSLNTDTTSGKVVIQHFNCRSLSIGTWRRVGQSQMDLIIFYSPEKACITYYINNDSAGYKIEYPFAWIKNINLVQGDMNTAAEGAQQMGALVVELNRPPKFYMDASGGGGFYECSDFTEDQQASSVMMHNLGGPSKILSGQLAKLVSLDCFQNRHLLNPTLTISAPVSPIGHRPASQPNHMVHPHMQANPFPEQVAPMGLMGPPAPRGHKRQRSRSVPAAIDVSMFRQPMPPFLLQQQLQQAPQTPAPHMHEPAIFAPQPQHHHQNAFAPGPNLSIDTSAGYGMDFRQFAGPMSATTLNSPSEFGTPAFFSGAPTTDAVQANAFTTPYSSSFLAVDPAAMIGTSNTPLSFASGDPVIADQSPPFGGLGRSRSADIFSTPGDHPSLSEDALSLDMAKSMQVPFKSPMTDFHSTPYTASFSEQGFNFQSPPPSSHKMDLPFRTHEHNMNFQTPTHQSQQHPLHQQQHQDSGVMFTSPNDPSAYHTPKETNSILYQDKQQQMYNSPGQMHDSFYQTPANGNNNNNHNSSQQSHHHQQQLNNSSSIQHSHHKFETPAQQLSSQDHHSFYTNSPLGDDGGEELDLSSFVQYGTIDPASL